MTDEKKLNLFVTDLRRMLYLSKIFLYSLDWMKMSELCPSYLKVDINNIQNSINRMFADMAFKSTAGTWEKVRVELSKDELHDLSLLMDSVSNVTNVGEIVAIIESWKTEIIEKDAA